MANEQQLGPTAQKVLAYLRQHPRAPFAAGDVCEAIDCSITGAGTALETLASAGLIDRQESRGGAVAYFAR